MFYLGTHKPGWLFREEFRDIPLFISHNALRDRRTLGKAVTRWSLDSGGFTQLSKNPAGWPPGCEEPYVEAVYRYAETGTLDFASQQDWMCEPWLLHDRSVTEHQERTVENFLTLRDLAPDLPWLPVLQGWEIDDYTEHLQMWQRAGVDLTTFPRVGVGSVCRRQHSEQIGEIMRTLSDAGIAIHGFGVKTEGLRKYAGYLESADSMAWSFCARYENPLPGHTHQSCANCPVYALQWRERLVSGLRIGGIRRDLAELI